MSANYGITFKIEADPDKRRATALEKNQRGISQDQFSGTEWDMNHLVWDYGRAAGTYVEMENTGDVLNFDASELRVEDTYEDYVESWSSPAQSMHVELPRTGRPVVLLAVGGGNQEFDHWDAWVKDAICVGQGARCEVPEPAADYGFSLFALAVFKKKPGDTRLGALDLSQTERHLPEPPKEP